MNGNESQDSEFEQRTRAVLEESLTRIDGRIRSRLNQARHAAVAEADSRGRPFWRTFTIFPVAGAVAAALLVAIVLWPRADWSIGNGEVAQPTLEDIDLLADGEALDLIEEWDGAFYEWAVAQSELGDEASI